MRFHGYDYAYAYRKQQLVIDNKDDADGRAKVTTDEEWVVHVN